MKNKVPEISAIVVAKNEEKKIKDCLLSIDWVDEIIFVDSGSVDKTKDIARKHKAKIFDFKGGGYSDWRNEGLKKARGKWVLYIDADERGTDELKHEIENIMKNYNQNFSTFAIPRKNIILGRALVHGGWWPDYVKRLYKKEFLKGWRGDLHEEPVYEGNLAHLQNPLIHIKHDNFSDMVDKTNKWSEIEAKLMYEAKHPQMNVIRFATAMLREFWLRMIKNMAFLDGAEGIIYALYQVYSKFISYAKLWEIQIKEK